MSNQDSNVIDRDERLEDRPLDPENAIKVPLPILTGGLKPSRVKHRSYQLLICIPVFFFLFTSALCGLQIHITNSESVNKFAAIKDVIYNIIKADCESMPIIAIKAIDHTKGETCPGYVPESIGGFGGSRGGCYDSKTATVFTGSCPSDSGYSYMEPTPPWKLWSWRQQRFCVQRLSKLISVSEKSECQEYQIACRYQSGYICVDKTAGCPIADIKILPYEIPVPSTYTIQPFGSGYYRLIYSKDPHTSGRLTGLLVSLNSLPCLDPLEWPSRVVDRNSVDVSSLMIKKENNCADFGVDYDSKNMDSYSERDVYKENGLGKIFEVPRVNLFTEGNNLTLNAQYTKGVKKDPECNVCKNTTYTELKKVAQEIWETHQFYVVFSRFGVILVIVMLITAVYNIVSYLLSHKDAEVTYLRVSKVNSCVFSYMLGHFLTAGILSILNYHQISGTIGALNSFVDAKCFDNNKINIVLEDLHKNVLTTSLEMTLDGGLIIGIAILANTVVVIANYILSGIKKPEGTPHEEVRPLRVQELELENQSRNYENPVESQGNKKPDNPEDDAELD